jgi:murein L,D-transpeptidase YafK
MIWGFRFSVFLSVMLLAACAGPKVDYVVVDKSDAKMMLIKDDKVLKSFNVAFGSNPVGHKMEEGDGRTPEGVYMLDFKNPNSKFYKSIRISYPNEQDILSAQQRGVNPGGDIVIHGFPNNMRNYYGQYYPQNWTQGCIAVRNQEMDQIWALVAVNTPIEIRP